MKTFLNKIFYFKKDGNKKKERLYTALCKAAYTEGKKASKLFNKYVKYYGENDIIKDFHLCHKLYLSGAKNEEVEKSAFIYQQLIRNIESKNFETYLKNSKNIAIVGNSGRELGKKQGAFIDSHDIVIRFNNYPSNYKEDYGTKCNVWFRGYGAENEILDRNLEEFDHVVFGWNLLNKNVPKHIITWLYDNLKKCPNKISFISSREYLSQYNLKVPTNGFIVLTYIYQFIDRSNIDIFGFSFLDEEGKEDNAHYYDNLCNIVNHSITDERKILRDIFIRKGKENETSNNS